MPQKKKHIAFWIIFPIVMVIITSLLIFYFDLANGPLVWFIVELSLIVAFIVIRILFRDRKFWVRLLTWVGFFGTTVAIIAFCKPTTEIKSAAYYSNPTPIAETLNVTSGKVKGIYNVDKTVKIYAGIRYATAERWKEPVAYVSDKEIDGSYFGPRSMQPASNPLMDSLVDIYAEKGWHPDYTMHPYQNMSEDSLYLNIWKPNTDATNLPILVYIHGGSLTSGTSAYEAYNGETMAKQNVIMITIQYRLGVFGYFAHPDLKAESPNHTTGNYGLLDQIQALKWINENAASFGGDKNNITIAGESAGSSSVCALCTSDLAAGLFKRAIGESSSLAIKLAPHTYRTEEEAYKTSANILNEFGCTTIEQLRKVDASKLVNTSYSNSGMMMDGYALKKDPYQVYLDGQNNEEALLNGYNVLESDAFVVPQFLFSPTNAGNIKSRLTSYFNEETANQICELYKDRIAQDAFSAFNEIISVYWFIMPHHSWSNLALNNGVDVYRYQFTKENGFYGTYHSGEMIYCYGNIDRIGKPFAYDQKDYDLSKIMVTYWSNFAKTGNPNGEGVATWNKYVANGQVQELGVNVGPINDKYLELYTIIDHFLDTKIAELAA